MFDTISARYDLLNHLLSFGLDVCWRSRLRRFLPTGDEQNILDLATGTADVLLTLTRHNSRVAEAVGIDLAEKMLAIGREKIVRANLSDKITLMRGDANHIPLRGDKFDAVTMAFGIRNVEDPVGVLKEMRRVLNKGGRALVLEFSLPENQLLRAGHLFYLRTVVPLLGGLVSGHREAYQYLNQTIERFPYGAAFCKMMEEAGLRNPTANILLGGVATIYQGEK